MADPTIAHKIQRFYNLRSGRLIRRFIDARIRLFWNDLHGFRVMGYGYSLPFLRQYTKEAESIFAVMPETIGVHFWPLRRQGNLGGTCLSTEVALPVETESVDRIVIAHGIENSNNLDTVFDELWRVLKSDGRMLIIVPNRLGLWARAEWTPFGHGRPYSKKQILNLLAKHNFVYKRSQNALFMPPFKSFLALRTAYFFESFGRFIFPGLAGVHILEVSKQVYAGKTIRKQTVKKGRYVIADQTAGV